MARKKQDRNNAEGSGRRRAEDIDSRRDRPRNIRHSGKQPPAPLDDLDEDLDQVEEDDQQEEVEEEEDEEDEGEEDEEDDEQEEGEGEDEDVEEEDGEDDDSEDQDVDEDDDEDAEGGDQVEDDEDADDDGNEEDDEAAEPSGPKGGKKEIVDLPLSKLRPHPLNDEVYRQRTPEEVQDLASQMKKNGLTEPVEVTPGHEIICGHGRVAAARLLGWKRIRCWVRRDLAKAGKEAIKRRLIESNLHRRQLSRLDLVRSFRELKRLEKDRRGYSLSAEKVRGDLRDIVANRFKPPVSGKTLERWEKVLDLPMPLQEAFDQEELNLKDALKVAALPKMRQEQMAEELRKGKPLSVVLARYLEQDASTEASDAEVEAGAAASLGLDRLLRALARAREELGPVLKDLRRFGFCRELEQLKKGKRLIRDVMAQIEENQARRAAESSDQADGPAEEEE